MKHAIIAAVIIIMLVGIPYLAWRDYKSWNQHVIDFHCVQTSETRTRTYTTYVRINNMNYPQIHTVTEHKWKCDDANYWR